MPDASALRDRLLSALLADPNAVLRERSEAVARVIAADGEQIVLLTEGPDLAERARVLIGQHKRGPLQIVAVAAGPALDPVLKSLSPTWQINRRIGLFRLDAGGELIHVDGGRSDELGRAVVRMPEVRQLDDAELTARVGHVGEGQREVARLAGALGKRVPWVTTTVAAVCVLLFLLGQLWAGGAYGVILTRMGANNGALVKAGEVWRVLASAFLHGSLMHLVVNMIALVSFGALLEKLLGARRYLLLYGLSALGGGLASAFLRGAGSSVGASGAIWGLMTAGVGLALRPRGLLPPLVLQRAKRTALVPLAMNAGISFLPGIDLYAHFGGGAVGFALWMSGIITLGVKPAWTEGAPAAAPERREPWLLTAGAGLTVAALAVSVVAALAQGKPWTFTQALSYERVTIGKTGLTLDMPSVLAGDVQVVGGTVLYGKPGTVPVIVGVTTAAAETSDLPDVPGMSRKTAYGRDWLTSTQHLKNNMTVSRWFTVLGGTQIAIDVASNPSRPDTWNGLEEHVLGSLRGPP